MINFKKKYLITIIIIIFSTFFFIKADFFRSIAREYLPSSVKIFVKELIFGEEEAGKIFKKQATQEVEINYNQKRLPETEFLKINLQEFLLKDLNIDSQSYKYKLFHKQPNTRKFYIEKYKEDILIASSKGKIFLIKKSFIKDNNLKWIEVNSNLSTKFDIEEILDLLVLNDELYISFTKIVSENCRSINIYNGKIVKQKINLKKFFQSKECLKNAVGGRMMYFKYLEKEGLLFTTGTLFEEKEKAQNDKSVFGKILFIDFESKNYKVFSKGHRNPQGLTVNNNIIISTEHGPRGGDEINLIEFGNNYGWPLASYGEPYFSQPKKNKVYDYLKNHEDNGFIEPIYSFVPSIGISEIIKVPDNFSKHWKNNYLIASLGSASIYRVLFDKKFSKIFFIEKIYIGERIRDIIYLKEDNLFLLALENTGSIAIMRKTTN